MQEITLQDLIRLLKKKWWFITLFTLISIATAGYISYYHLTPIFSNSSTILVNDQDRTQNPLNVNDVMLNEKLIGTYKDILLSQRILNPVVEQLEQPITEEQIRSMTRISNASNSQVMRITVTHNNYLIATEIANLIAETFSKNLINIMTIDNVQILDPAEIKNNPHPIKPKKVLNVFWAFVLGLIISISLILIIHLLDTRIRTEEDLSSLIEYPLLGSIPNYSKQHQKTLYR